MLGFPLKGCLYIAITTKGIQIITFDRLENIAGCVQIFALVHVADVLYPNGLHRMVPKRSVFEISHCCSERTEASE
jgi:hypothetical protein